MVLWIAALSATSISEKSWSNVLASWSRQCLASEVTNATLSNVASTHMLVTPFAQVQSRQCLHSTCATRYAAVVYRPGQN